MIVIVPHRDLELKLINSQKKIIRQIIQSNADVIPYAAMPLWIPVEFETVEQAKKEIQKVTVMAPEYDEEGCFVCPVKIECADGKILERKLDFVRGLPHLTVPEPVEGRNDENDSTFPLPVKIFRLGECTSPKPGVYELASSVWKKTTS